METIHLTRSIEDKNLWLTNRFHGAFAEVVELTTHYDVILYSGVGIYNTWTHISSRENVCNVLRAGSKFYLYRDIEFVFDD